MTCSGDGIRHDLRAIDGNVAPAHERRAPTSSASTAAARPMPQPRHPRLDRIAFSRGRFALETPGGNALTLPVQYPRDRRLQGVADRLLGVGNDVSSFPSSGLDPGIHSCTPWTP
jgi:hypothetical protein